MAARLKSISVRGFKSLGDVTLPLEGLSVLIGDNGSGKSSILEVLEILRSTTEQHFASRIASAHGGLSQLLEHGAREIVIMAVVDDGEPDSLLYFQRWSNDAFVPYELVGRHDAGPEAYVLADRMNDTTRIRGVPTQLAGTKTDSLVFAGSALDPDIRAVASVLRNIDVHLPFRVSASWAEQDRKTPRGVTLIEPTTRLERFGTNLVNAYQALKNDFGIDHWNETLEYIQLGLGHEIRDVRLEAIPGGGHMALSLEIVGQGRVPAFSLADGMLSYLAFVALFRLDEGRTLLAFDEPELHLHPGLLGRVLGLFEAMSDSHPVVLATHSDRLLDGLSDPAGSVVVTELDERSRTRLRRLDRVQLAKWIGDYRGLGELRADGELVSVLADPVEPATTPSLP